MVINTKRVASVCDETFLMYKYGGTLLRRDDENFLLSDVSCVTCSQIQHMQACLPQLKVQVMSSDGSTSGFVLVLSVSTQQTVATAHSCVHMGMQFVLFVCFFVFILHKHMEFLNSMAGL